MDSFAKSLTQGHVRSYSVSSLNDMRRFYEGFQILQAVSVESSDQMHSSIRQTLSSEFLPHRILQTTSGESPSVAIWQAVPAKSSEKKSEGVRPPSAANAWKENDQYRNLKSCRSSNLGRRDRSIDQSTCRMRSSS